MPPRLRLRACRRFGADGTAVTKRAAALIMAARCFPANFYKVLRT